MNSTETKVWRCSCCGIAYMDKQFAEDCCVERPVKVCDVCGKPMDKMDCHTVCSPCRAEKLKIKEQERYAKATHYTIKTAPKESTEWFYSESYMKNEGFFDDFENETMQEHDIKYVYGTKRISPTYDAQDLIDSMLENSYEDAVERVSETEIDKLQTAIDDFVKNHNGRLDWFEVDYSVVIDL